MLIIFVFFFIFWGLLFEKFFVQFLFSLGWLFYAFCNPRTKEIFSFYFYIFYRKTIIINEAKLFYKELFITFLSLTANQENNFWFLKCWFHDYRWAMQVKSQYMAKYFDLSRFSFLKYFCLYLWVLLMFTRYALKRWEPPQYLRG